MDFEQLQELIKSYQPDTKVTQGLRNITLVTFTSPTAAGKTTLIEYITSRDTSIKRVITDVSRAPRHGEKDGVDYHFRSKDDMLADLYAKRFIQVAPSVNGDIYASRPENFGSSGIVAMGVYADAMPVFRALPFKQIRSIFVVPPSYEVWQKRIIAHNFTAENYILRLYEAKRSLLFAEADKQLYYLLNDNLAEASETALAIAKGRALNTKQLKTQKLAKITVNKILAKLDEELKKLKLE